MSQGAAGRARQARTMTHAVPLVAVATDIKNLCGQPVHAVARKYVDPLLEIAGCLPLLLPSFGTRTPVDDVLASVHGLLFSGSPSNIEPHHYGEALDNPESPADPERDATTLPLIRAAIERGMPVFGICRGFQEINVALGGSLLQQVHFTEGYADHREDESLPLEQQYGPAHEVHAVPGSWLEGLVGRPNWSVNSLHGQGIKRLAPGLVAQAHAPDGLVEAYTHANSAGLLLAVQWHPEWRAMNNPVSRSLFHAFGEACRAYAAQRLAPQAPQRRAERATLVAHAEAA
ncbi:MAG: gamma-glutamyl-gamma-aminobutyrate hydrolase family protein [Betaproteobacteria bacterium]|nr:gamma-glutamyl-gamma-aminobutyrate hydrolase family protein [Betaproteobacteria bacterium]MBU6513567.1 gamma-glutamyl-gamma-aminobutyrate hydrolase family protein [Betaproteobacteria bacterium]MDE1956372.1 gamma-glutamyl-gamma-aminobutyrate hydrolase family protein [Betaproteobacteria bacterium]MDE2151037.1 gamma-glutamyl-gamma-aminobutyrate hydrolase family protein [Betaproteobacteria bacterium]MDE2477493.1 gamma-glutamyl-gamma-aminobutyrate hydrolase family protein [Betaproteobacteria bact